MLIKMAVLEAIKRGDIDIQFRRWKRATVRPRRHAKNQGRSVEDRPH
jgi:hypothetical protein